MVKHIPNKCCILFIIKFKMPVWDNNQLVYMLIFNKFNVCVFIFEKRPWKIEIMVMPASKIKNNWTNYSQDSYLSIHFVVEMVNASMSMKSVVTYACLWHHSSKECSMATVRQFHKNAFGAVILWLRFGPRGGTVILEKVGNIVLCDKCGTLWFGKAVNINQRAIQPSST